MDCIYCGIHANTRDHFIPWSYDHSGKRKKLFSKNDKKDNIVPACLECNSTAGNKVFSTIQEKQEYIQSRYEKKYKTIINLPDWSEKELDELGASLRKDTSLKMIAKKWIINRIAYPTVIYQLSSIDEQVDQILRYF